MNTMSDADAKQIFDEFTSLHAGVDYNGRAEELQNVLQMEGYQVMRECDIEGNLFFVLYKLVKIAST